MFIGKNVLKHLVSLSVIKEDIIVEDWDNHILMSPVNDSKASPLYSFPVPNCYYTTDDRSSLFQGRIGAVLFIFRPRGFAGSL